MHSSLLLVKVGFYFLKELGIYNLIGVVLPWWHAIEFSAEVESYSWELFEIAFRIKFILDTMNDVHIEKFLQISLTTCQGIPILWLIYRQEFIKGLDHHIIDHYIIHRKEPMGCILDFGLKWEQNGIEFKKKERHK